MGWLGTQRLDRELEADCTVDSACLRDENHAVRSADFGEAGCPVNAVIVQLDAAPSRATSLSAPLIQSLLVLLRETVMDAGKTDQSDPKPQAQWVKTEWRDLDGNPTFPDHLIASTAKRRFDEREDRELSVYVLAGPRSVMMIERKLYRVHELQVHGWRRRGQLVAEMEGWREHEAEWFSAMRGLKMTVRSSDTFGRVDEADYTITTAAFERLLVTTVDHKRQREKKTHLYEGTLDIRERWRSTLQRQKASITEKGINAVILPLFLAIVSALLTLWITGQLGSPNP